MRLHVRTSRFMHYNAGVFVSRDDACLVDPGITPDEIRELAELAGDRAATAVLTHSDWDHVLGPERLPGSRVVAHAAYETTLDPQGIRVVLGQLEEHAGIERETPFEPPHPDETFERSLELRVGEIVLELEHAPGHTRDMLTLYLPATATLWAADMLSDVEIPLVAYDLAAYEDTLSRIASLDLRTVVPGHGTPTEDPSDIRRRIDEDRRYLAGLRAGVAEAVEEGRSLEETTARCESVGPRRSEGDATSHRLNVEKVYADLGGHADPSEVGFVRAWRETTGR